MLHHKNITNYKNVIETQTHIFFIMERVTGGELYEFLKKKKFFTGKKAYLFYLNE